MREIIIIIICVIIIILGAMLIQNRLEKTSEQLILQLVEIRKDIKKDKSKEKIKEKVKKLYKEWEETEETWSFIVLHDELDLIEISLTTMKTSLEIEDTKKCLEELETSIFLLNHIPQKEKLGLKNIF